VGIGHATERGDGGKREDELRRNVERALIQLSTDPAGALRLLYPSSYPTTAYSGAAFCPFSSATMRKILAFQAHCADDMLKQHLNTPLGLADDRVAILNVQPKIGDYTAELARIVGQCPAIHENDRFGKLLNLRSRLWRLDGAGLSHIHFVSNDIARIHRDSQRPGTENQAQMDNIHPSNTTISAMNATKGKNSILVVLGFLPSCDEIDIFLRANERRLMLAPGQTADGAHPDDQKKASPGSHEHTAPMSIAEYWDAFAVYLNKRPQTAHPTPVTPREYRNLLIARQQLRGHRLRSLHAFTGIRRANARDDDVLAGSQAIFFRLGELLLQEPGIGLLSLAADPVWLAHQDMEGMRKSLLTTFNHIILDELAPAAPSGARVPEIAIGCMVKTGAADKDDCVVSYRKHDGGKTLFLHPQLRHASRYQSLAPRDRDHTALRPGEIPGHYSTWPSLAEIAAAPPMNGLMEKRQGALVDIDRECLESRMRSYFDKNIPWRNLVAQRNGMTVPQSRFEPKAVREMALAASGFNQDAIQPYLAKPFDTRWCYYSAFKSLWGDPKPPFAELCLPDNRFVVARAHRVVAEEGMPLFYSSSLGDNDLLRGHSYYFPIWHFDGKKNRIPNLSGKMVQYLAALGLLQESSILEASRKVWNHVLAVGFSPLYLDENGEGLGYGWPRIPFPSPRYGDAAHTALLESARLGEAVAWFLGDDGGAAFGVSTAAGTGRHMAVLWNTKAGAPISPGQEAKIPVTMNWGKMGGARAVLPSHGRLSLREYDADEKRALEREARAFGVHAGGAYACLGEETFDVHLNEKLAVRNVPSKVWEFTVGGYQVLKKWLSYREMSILGRPLSQTEVGNCIEIARRISALLLLGPQLNHSYAVARDMHSR
jgi:hypothetical protein